MSAFETFLLVLAVVAIVIAFIEALMLSEAFDQIEDAQDAAAAAIQDANRRATAAGYPFDQDGPQEAPRG